jgi:hypothetical protein
VSHSYNQGSIGDNITISISNHTWICAICSQGFTRKGTGVRHSRNLHSGNVMLVRPYEYIVGRLRGTYKQSDPLLFRRKRREGNTTITRLTSVNNPRSTKPIEFQNSVIHERHGPQQKGNQRVDTYGVGTQPGPSLRLPEQISGHMPMKDMRNRSEKLKEITELVRMHYPPETARSIIIAASFQACIRDDSSLDQTVEYLRNIPKR